MKELEEIIKKHFGETRWMLTGEIQKADMLLFAKEIYNKGVTDSAESVRTDRGKTHNDCGECGYTEIDKQSILKNLIP